MLYVTFTIPGNPVTKKNSQRIGYKRGKGGKMIPFILPSKKFKEYEAMAIPLLVEQAGMNELIEPISVPVNVEIRYWVKDARDYDLSNLEEATDDILVAAGILLDDNYKILATHDGSRVEGIDRENPRAVISIYETFARS